MTDKIGYFDERGRATGRTDGDSRDPVDIAVIGAGIAGLSAAVYARSAGFTARVFESHRIAGGLCTAWNRSGYAFDYCVDYFLGTTPDQGFHRLWEELGVTDSVRFTHIDSFGRYLGRDGASFELFTDPDRLYREMTRISPRDARAAKSLTRAISRVRRFLPTSLNIRLRDVPAVLSSIPALYETIRWSKLSAREWASRLTSPLLREALPALIGADTPMGGAVLVFGMMRVGAAEYPLGGSLSIVGAVEKKARDLGAEFRFNTRVERIALDAGRVTGLYLSDGSFQPARYVVAAADAKDLFDRLLEGKAESPEYKAMFEGAVLQPPIVQVSLGVRIDPDWGLDSAPYSLIFPVSPGITVDGKKHEGIRLRHYARDSSMAPKGCTVCIVRYEADYSGWERLYSDMNAYRKEKDRILQETIRALEDSFPGISSRIEASDVTTPLSCARYTRNWQGSTQGWLMNSEMMRRMLRGETLPRTVAGVEGLYLAGQWTEPGGGLPPSARSAKEAIQSIVKHDRRRGRKRG